MTLLAVLALALVAVGAVRGWIRAGDAGEPVWIAHSGYVQTLREVQVARTRYRRRAVLGALAAALVMTCLAVLVTVPASTEPQHRRLTSRDVVFCLDASGSMLPVDAEILSALDAVVAKFHGERVGLVLWNASVLTVFPPTDDYQLVTDRITWLRDLMTSVQVKDNEIYVNRELHDYLQGTSITTGEASSLVGDALATCVSLFPKADTPRSRSLVLATDNIQLGEGIYTLPQAADVAAAAHIRLSTIYALAPQVEAHLTDIDPAAHKNELKRETERVGGTFYEAGDPGLNEELFRGIFDPFAHEDVKQLPPIYRDQDHGWVVILAAGFLVLALVAWRLRL